VKWFDEEIYVAAKVIGDKRKWEKQVHVDGIDLVDWFLAIDVCLA
jgi:hypothetical protein